MTTGHIGRMLFTRSLPIIVGVLGMVSFNLIDTYFVGKLGADELAALSFTFPIVFFFRAISFGLGIGASAVISRAFGARDKEQIRRLTTDSFGLALMIVAVFVIVGLNYMEWMFQLVGVTPEVMPLVREYMEVWFWGVGFVVVLLIGNNVLRASGDTATPSWIVVSAIVINIIFDYLLIFGIGPFPRWELKGAALATVGAHAVGLVVTFWIIGYRNKMISLKFPGLAKAWESSRLILYIALPTAGAQIIIPIGWGLITRFISSYGPEAVASIGVASRIEMFLFVIIFALTGALGPFVGQNFGAGKFDRLKRGVDYSHRFGFFWGVGMFIALRIAAKTVVPFFTDEPGIIAAAVDYLYILPLGYAFMCLLIISNTALNALNRPLYAAGLNFLQLIGLFVPLAMLGMRFIGMTGVFWALVAANTVSGTLSVIILRRVIAGYIGKEQQ